MDKGKSASDHPRYHHVMDARSAALVVCGAALGAACVHLFHASSSAASSPAAQAVSQPAASSRKCADDALPVEEWLDDEILGEQACSCSVP